ncbi:MAG: hypothetical protein EOP90_09990 [Lysobacteraceae bacterium]|nr:MAG: hypothetical protein EOP90_09990 [Xanthomonadaceae bacterium]
MTANNAASDVLVAVNLLQHARKACADFRPLGSPMTPMELEQRERIIDTVVRTRRLLQSLQANADARGAQQVRSQAMCAG